MLGQQKKNTVPGWAIILMAVLLLLVAIPLFIRTVGGELNISLLDWRAQSQESAQTLTPPSVAVLQAAKPDFTGGAVPEATMGEEAVSVEVLRAAKPDFTGGALPESTIGGQRFATDVEFPSYDEQPNLYFP